MLRCRCGRTLLRKWSVPTSAGKAEDPSRTITWGRVSARGTASAYDQGVEAHVSEKNRNVNRAAPRGLLRGFADEKQPPALPSSSKKR